MSLLVSDYTELSTAAAPQQLISQPAVLTDEFVNVVVTVRACWYTIGEMHWAKRDMPSAFGCNPSGATDSKTCIIWAVFTSEPSLQAGAKKVQQYSIQDSSPESTDI